MVTERSKIYEEDVCNTIGNHNIDNNNCWLRKPLRQTWINVNKTQETAPTQEQELFAVDLLRAHPIENGEKTKDDHRLTL